MVSSLPADSFSTDMPFFTTSAGRRASAFFTRFWMSTAARSGSVEMSKVTAALKLPELELDDSIYSMPGTPLISCSIGVATAWVTVWASAPG